ncbi:hypothetical protein K438DRAFT_1842112 [Mycena galopus ATCC 62051]|nr:hypothetical protein K438DRAFT_1842112 [Mycena galopus ATCC 62051]
MSCGPTGTGDASSTRLATAGSNARAVRNSMRQERLATSARAGAAGDECKGGSGWRRAQGRERLATSARAGAADDERKGRSSWRRAQGRELLATSVRREPVAKGVVNVLVCQRVGRPRLRRRSPTILTLCCAILVAWATAAFLPHGALVEGMNRRRW